MQDINILISDVLIALAYPIVIALLVFLIYNYVSRNTQQVIEIGLIGYPGTGKTTFLTTFLSDLHHARFRGIGHLESKDQFSKRRLSAREIELIRDHKKVGKTEKWQNDLEHVAMKFGYTIKILGFMKFAINKEFHLLIRDFAGEFVEELGDEEILSGKYFQQPEYLSFVSSAHVLILFIDLSETLMNRLAYEDAYIDMLNRINKNKDKRPLLLIAYNKADLLDCESPEEIKYWSKEEVPKISFKKGFGQNKTYSRHKETLDKKHEKLLTFLKSKNYEYYSFSYSPFWRERENTYGPTVTSKEIFERIKQFSIKI